jgi:hypothetical protein
MLPDIKFSFNEIKNSILYIVISVVSLLLIAIIKFELEYFTGIEIEALMEFMGVLKNNWIKTHGTLFLHLIQILFIITFLAEVKILIRRLTRNWML